MRWLVTVKKSYDSERLSEAVRRSGGERDEIQEPIPLADGQLVIAAEGPESLETALRELPDVVEIYPDSDPVAY